MKHLGVCRTRALWHRSGCRRVSGRPDPATKGPPLARRTPQCDWVPTHGRLVRHVEQCRLFAGADKRGPMRTLVDPPPSLRCDLCNGELRLKKIERDTSPLESDITTFVCAKCDRVKLYRVSRDPHSASRASMKPPPNVD
jgi:hypothetical protein